MTVTITSDVACLTYHNGDEASRVTMASSLISNVTTHIFYTNVYFLMYTLNLTCRKLALSHKYVLHIKWSILVVTL